MKNYICIIGIIILIGTILYLILKKRKTQKVEAVFRIGGITKYKNGPLSIYDKIDTTLEIDIYGVQPKLLADVKVGDVLYVTSTKPEGEYISVKLKEYVPLIISCFNFGEPLYMNKSIFDNDGNLDKSKLASTYGKDLQSLQYELVHHFTNDSGDGNSVNLFIHLGEYNFTNLNQQINPPFFPIGVAFYITKL